MKKVVECAYSPCPLCGAVALCRWADAKKNGCIECRHGLKPTCACHL